MDVLDLNSNGTDGRIVIHEGRGNCRSQRKPITEASQQRIRALHVLVFGPSGVKVLLRCFPAVLIS